MKKWCDLEPAERFQQVAGLNAIELEYLCRCFNGIPAFDQPTNPAELISYGIAKQSILQTVCGEATNSHEELMTRDIWLETLDSNPEQPYTLHDLAEKIRSFDEFTCACLLFYIEGWWQRARFEQNLPPQ